MSSILDEYDILFENTGYSIDIEVEVGVKGDSGNDGQPADLSEYAKLVDASQTLGVLIVNFWDAANVSYVPLIVADTELFVNGEQLAKSSYVFDNFQGKNSNLTAISLLGTQSYGRSFLELLNAAAARNLTGLNNVENVAASTTYLALSGGTLTGTLNARSILFTTDNAYDIGASGATRPRTLYVGTSIIGPNTFVFRNSGTAVTGAYQFQDSAGNIRADIDLVSAMFRSDIGFSARTNSRAYSTSGSGVDLVVGDPIRFRSASFGSYVVGMRFTADTVEINNGTTSSYRDLLLRSMTLSGGLNLAAITKSTLLASSPNATTGGHWRVTDSTPAQREVYPDGTNWRYVSDDSIVT